MAIDPNQTFSDSRFVGTLEPQFYRDVVKRLLDLVILTALFVPVTLLVLTLAVIVGLTGGSPFYSQIRVGINGRNFRMWKLRSMVPHADRKLGAYLASNPDAKAEWDCHQKLKNDPRITRFGAFLRKTSLDELPQLWNVLMGEMSLVGPRPMMREQRVIYPGTDYYSLVPGITGFWQISERNETSFAERAHFDTAYYQNLSLWTDLVVLYQTIDVVLRGTGR